MFNEFVIISGIFPDGSVAAAFLLKTNISINNQFQWENAFIYEEEGW